MTTTVSEWGNSLAIRIPKKEIKRLGLKAGSRIRVSPAKEGFFIEPLDKARDFSHLLVREQIATLSNAQYEAYINSLSQAEKEEIWRREKQGENIPKKIPKKLDIPVLQNNKKVNGELWKHIGFPENILFGSIFLSRNDMRRELVGADPRTEEIRYIRQWYRDMVPKDQQDSAIEDVFASFARLRDEEGFVFEKGEDLLGVSEENAVEFSSPSELAHYLKKHPAK